MPIKKSETLREDCQTFDAMSVVERRNLARLSYWLQPDYHRNPGEHLIGPEYEALRQRGVIDSPFKSAAEGKPVRITDLGRAVLHFIEGGL